VQCNQQANAISCKLLIENGKYCHLGIIPVLQITHYGIFDTDTVADYELKM